MLDSFHSHERQLLGRVGEREWREYKRFAFRDDMFKLAVGVMLANSFNRVVQSISDNLAMPILSFLTLNTGEAWREWAWRPTEGLAIKIGRLAGDSLDFLVISLVLYLLYVKLVGRIQRAGPGSPPPSKRCSLCMEMIHPDAVRCKFCGGKPNAIERRDGIPNKGTENGGSRQQGPDGAGGKAGGGAEGPRKPNRGPSAGRRIPRPRRKR